MNFTSITNYISLNAYNLILLTLFLVYIYVARLNECTVYFYLFDTCIAYSFEYLYSKEDFEDLMCSIHGEQILRRATVLHAGANCVYVGMTM